MTEDKPLDDALFQQAVDLMIHWQTGQHDPEVIAAVEHWKRQSPQHAEMWAEMLDIHQLAGEALASPTPRSMNVPEVTSLASRRFSRRQILWGSAAALAAVGVSTAFGPQLLLKAGADFTTDTAQTRQIPFGTGTRILLGPDSAVNCRITEQERQVELLAGLAYFEVSSDNTLPLKINAGGLNILTTRGQFDISYDDHSVRTMVASGSVEIARSETRYDSLTAGDWLKLNTRNDDIARGEGDIQQVAAWRDGRVLADNEPLDTVISRIARWQPGKVIITSSQLGAERVNGLYHLNNPLDALKAAVRPYGGRVHQLSPWLTIISAA